MCNEAVAAITTPRLRLRAFRAEDRAALHAYQMDSETMSTFGGGIALTAEEAERVLKYHIECRAYPNWAWAVTLPPNDVCIGQVTAGWSDYKGEKWIELAWILNKASWGHGYGTEAVAAMIAHGRSELGWSRIMAAARTTNGRSLRLMENVRMKRVGRETTARGIDRHIFEMP